MNLSDDERKTSGIEILWPDSANNDYKTALEDAYLGISFNNLSVALRYSVQNNASFVWLGDLETDFMEKVEEHVSLPHTPIVFAPHHGRKSGKIPNSWLDKLKPRLIVIGEAPSRHLHYYSGYNIITQNMAWDITFDMDDDNKVDIYVDNPNYKPQSGFLTDRGKTNYKNYIGTLTI